MNETTDATAVFAPIWSEVADPRGRDPGRGGKLPLLQAPTSVLSATTQVISETAPKNRLRSAHGRRRQESQCPQRDYAERR